MPLLSRRTITALALMLGALGPLAPAQAEGDSGAYLAARVAVGENDFRAAAAWYARAMLSDPSNPGLLEGVVISNMATGEFGLAADAARRLVATGTVSQAALLALIAANGKDGDFDSILSSKADSQAIGALLDQLTRAWAEQGRGRMTEALAAFDALAETPGLDAFALYHKALALALAGDFGGADEILSGRAAGEVPIPRRGVIAHVQILSQLERNPEAVALLDRAFGTDPDPEIVQLRARLTAGEPLPFIAARSAQDGLAEVFFSLASALNGEADTGYTLLYSRAASYLRPDMTEAALMSADLLQELGQYDLAVEAFASVPADNPNFHMAEIGRASALYAAGKKEAAVEVLQSLARSHGQHLPVQVALGDMLRREERFVDAIAVYDTAVAMIPLPAARHWPVFYSRGICHERQKEWPEAEADFRKALELQPDQPQVLNYLGYSFVDRGENLEEALSMIERAVAAQPNAGYIIDSLAWAYFRLGRYEEALAPMEKASVLEPLDPVVTDHLGDVYWAIGRKREADFQWHRALSFGPEEKDAIRIRRKLELGLDKVLAEEGAPPLRPEDSAEVAN